MASRAIRVSGWGLAAAVQLCLGTAWAQEEAVASSWAEVAAALNNPDVEEVSLSADFDGVLPGAPADLLRVNLQQTSKTLTLETDRPLAPMYIGNGELTVYGGNITSDTRASADVAVDNRITGHIIKIYGNARVKFSGLHIDDLSETTATPFQPPAVFALYSDERDPTGVDGTAPTEPARLELHELGNKDSPLSRALVVSTGATPRATELLLWSTELEFGERGSLHASVWQSDTGTTDSDDPMVADNALVEVLRSIFGAPDAAGSVGVVFENGETRRPFLESAGRVTLSQVALSSFETENAPLITAPKVVLEGLVIHDVKRLAADDGSPAGGIVEGLNIATMGSLFCGLQGDGAVFHAPALDAYAGSPTTLRSVHLMSSALWQVESSLFGMTPEASDSNNAGQYGLFARNLTLHHGSAGDGSSSARTPVVHRAFDSDSTVDGELVNVYLEGAWQLGVEVGESSSASEPLVVPTSVLMSDPDNTDTPCAGASGCSDLTSVLLDEGVVSTDCQTVMSAIQAPLFDERVSPLGWSRDLAELMPEELEDGVRPALRLVTNIPDAQDWTFDESSAGEWASSAPACTGRTEGEELYIGGYPSGRDSEDDPCVLPLLAPEQLQRDGTDEAEVAYGLAAGCRSSAMGVLVWLPLLGLRRRKGGGPQPDRSASSSEAL